MTRKEARTIIGNQPKWARRATAIALQLHPWLNTDEDRRTLAALRALGYKVTLNVILED